MQRIQTNTSLGLLALLLMGATGLNAALQLPAEVRIETYSLSRKGLAIEGYDPVAYFKQGPTKGSKDHSYTYKGVQYRFASAENLVAFKAEPHRYEPEYGAWCAWAMYDGGGRTKVDPETFKIVDGKLYLFYNGLFGDTLALWNEKIDNRGDHPLIELADKNWHKQVHP